MQNEFHDINKLPTTEGIFFLGISMTRINKGQSPKECFNYLKQLASKVQFTKGIGAEFLYGDYLYFLSDDPASVLRNRFKEQMVAHKNSFLGLLKKDKVWTMKAFSFKTFGQIILDNSEIFSEAQKCVTDLYKNDKDFQKYVELDCVAAGRPVTEMSTSFVLEEIAMFYLLQKGDFRLNNRFVTDAEKHWTLQAYPGKPLKSEVYLFQKNPLKLMNPKNIYENHFYDLEDKKLYDYTEIDLKTFDF